MPVKPQVSITLSCCPRCGWPDDETEATSLATTPSPRVKAEPPPRKDKIDWMVGRAWMASDFGISEAEFKKHFRPTLIRDGMLYLHCERLGHKHETPEQESKCILDWIEAERAKPATEGAVQALDDCVALKHAHGSEGKLICLMLKASMSKEHMTWLKAQPWNQEPQPRSHVEAEPKRPRGRPRKASSA